jgi:outer membrane protein insertion porin family
LFLAPLLVLLRFSSATKSRKKGVLMWTLLYNSRVSCRRIVPLVVLSFFSIAAAGQDSAKAKLSYKLLSIQVKGATQLNRDEIIRASGLTIGQIARDGDFKQAIERLGETGLFTNLQYSYHYSSEGCDLEFQITENPDLVPIVFDNFVWFSDEDLIGWLRARLPLFTGRLPVGGNFADEIAASLNAILDGRKIPGTAQFLRAGDGAVNSYVYWVSLHPVLVRNVDFPGADPAELAALEAAAKPLSGQPFSRTKIRPQEIFGPVYRAHGYLKVSFGEVHTNVAEDGPRTLVDLSFPVMSGRQYQLGATEWQGNTVFPAEKLQQFVHLKTGEPANAVQLDDDLGAVRKLYGTKGYLFARVDPTLAMDEAHSIVSYELNVTEGDLYRMGKLEVDGLDADASRRMAAQWQMKKGDPYDNSYLQRFFSIMYRDVGLRRPYDVVRKESINQQDKTVSVALHFMPKG